MSDGEGDYGNNENCTVKAVRPLVVNAEEFGTEFGWDYLTIDGTQYHGSEGPQGLLLDPDAELTWSSDGSVTSTGFTLCASDPGSFVIARKIVYHDLPPHIHSLVDNVKVIFM